MIPFFFGACYNHFCLKPVIFFVSYFKYVNVCIILTKSMWDKQGTLVISVSVQKDEFTFPSSHSGSTGRTRIKVICYAAPATHGSRAQVFHTVNKSLCIWKILSQKYILILQNIYYQLLWPCSNCQDCPSFAHSDFWPLEGAS